MAVNIYLGVLKKGMSLQPYTEWLDDFGQLGLKTKEHVDNMHGEDPQNKLGWREALIAARDGGKKPGTLHPSSAKARLKQVQQGNAYIMNPLAAVESAEQSVSEETASAAEEPQSATQLVQALQQVVEGKDDPRGEQHQQVLTVRHG